MLPDAMSRGVREMTEADAVSGTLPEAGERCSGVGDVREINVNLKTDVMYCEYRCYVGFNPL